MKTIYLDLQKQKRTKEQNEFTIPADSEEAKAFFTPKQPNQDLVIDIVNKTTYFKEVELKADGTRYSHYNTDGTPNLIKIAEDKVISDANELKAAKQVALDSIKVTVGTKEFDGRDKDQARMVAAIQSSKTLGLTEAEWKLADNTVSIVTLTEMEQALALSIQEVGRIVKATTIGEL